MQAAHDSTQQFSHQDNPSVKLFKALDREKAPRIREESLVYFSPTMLTFGKRKSGLKNLVNETISF